MNQLYNPGPDPGAWVPEDRCYIYKAMIPTMFRERAMVGQLLKDTT